MDFGGNDLNNIDLHLHSTASDGYLTVEEIIKLAYELKYDTISITDHDTIKGYLEAKKNIENYPINLIPGVEISSTFQEIDVHILAYFFDEENQELLHLLETIKNQRLKRAKRIIEKLENLGIIIDLNRIIQIAGNGGLLGRPHFAQALLELGYVSSLRNAFDFYLGDSQPCFVPKLIPSSQEVVDIVHRAGGLAVIAHPNRLPDMDVLDDLLKFNFDGMEVFVRNFHYYPDEHDQLKEIAYKHNLLMTGGTDFHGKDYEIEYFGNFSLERFYLDKLLAKKEKWND